MSDLVVVNLGLFAEGDEPDEGNCGPPGLGVSDDGWAEAGFSGKRLELAKRELDHLACLCAELFTRLGAIRIADVGSPDWTHCRGMHFCWVMERRFAKAVIDSWKADYPRGFIAKSRFDNIGMLTCYASRPIVYVGERPARPEVEVVFETSPLNEIFSELPVAPIDKDLCSITTPDRLPRPGETAEAWAARVAVDGQALIDAMDLFERCDKDPKFYLALRPSAEDTQFRFLVDGLFPLDVVSLVAGDGGVGKSTMLTELCAVVGSQSTDERTFLGQPVTDRGICMLFAGEDNPSFLMERQEFYRRQGHANGSQCFLINAANLSIDECISMVRRYKDRVKLAVFDPASKFFTSGNDNDAIDPQIGKLDALAAETGCAVVLVHHLTKGRVQQFSHLRDKIRGAGAFVNRPRLVLGIMRKGAEAARTVEVGILKHNIPPSQALWGELGKGRLFYQNPETLRLELLHNGQQRQGRPPPAESSNNAALERWILDTVRQRVAAGGEVRKTGRKSLHQGQQETGGSYSRLAIERAQDSLIAAGLLLDTEAGLRICEPAPPQ